MARIPGIRSLFRLPASEGRVTSEVEEEIAFHLEERTGELVARGMDPVTARAAALREFGDLGEARAELEEIGRRRVRRVHRSGWWSELRDDARYGWRTLLRSPGFTLVAVLTLALGIGATTAVFTAVDAVLLRPLGVGDPERVVMLRERQTDAGSMPRMDGTVSPANFFDWEAQATSFSSMSYFRQLPANLTGEGEPQEAQVQRVSANFFSTLGVQPLLGRGLRPEDVEGENPGQVAVLSHALWRSRFGGDPGVLGKTIRMNDTPLQVVGVMGPDFRVLDRRPDLWVPFPLPRGNRTTMGRFLTGVARLKPGVTLQEAVDEMDALARRLEEAYPSFNSGWGVALTPLREDMVGDVRAALLVLLGSVGMLLLIACTNVANLLLGRASARRAEIAVRLSLGATRGRLVRQLLTESLLLSVLGGAIGVTAAVVGTRALVRSLPESVTLPGLDAVAVDGPVLAFALGVTFLTGTLFGIAPALLSSRSELLGGLKDRSRGHTGGRAPMRLRKALVVAEVALALMLLVGAGLLLRSFQKLQAVDTGMNAQGVLTLRLSLISAVYESPEAQRDFVARLLPALAGLPGVQAAGTVSHLPLTDQGIVGHTAYRVDRPKPGPDEEPSVQLRWVAGDYFTAQGIRLVRGRAFDSRDHAGSATAFVINEALARQQFPGEDPVGKRLTYPLGEMVEGEIVGVVDDIHETSITQAPAPALYRAFAQDPFARMHVVIRSTSDPLALAGAARAVVRRLDPELPVASIRSMKAVVADVTGRSRMSSSLLGAFAAIALLLAAVGLYGVISYGVAQRQGEIGVRMALGANRGTILRLIVSQGMTLTAAGLALGLLGALALARLLQSLLYGVTTTDLATFLVVPLLLAAVALLASYVPANRAARVDPAIALRAE